MSRERKNDTRLVNVRSCVTTSVRLSERSIYVRHEKDRNAGKKEEKVTRDGLNRDVKQAERKRRERRDRINV